MKKIIAALAGLFALALPSAALAQCSGSFNPGDFCGNPGATAGLAGKSTATALFNRAFGTVNNGVLATNGSAVPAFTITIPSATQDNITRLGTIANVGAPIGATFGGTAQSSWAQGDILYASAVNTLAKLAAAGTGNALISGTTPSWGKIGLTTHVSGQLPLANGGCNGTTAATCLNNIMPTPTRAGDIAYWNGSTWVTIAGNNSGTNVLTENSTGVPSWTAPGTGTVTAGGGGIVPTSGGPATLFAEQMPVGGRLTLINGTCVATTDQAAATVVYYAPCGGGKYVPIYDGTNMELRQFTASDADTTGLTLTLGSNWAATTNYDVYIGLKSSVVTACTVAWTNSTTRATTVAQFKGVWTNGAVATCRDTNASTFSCAQNQCTLVGSFRTNGSTGQIDLKFGTNATNGGAACICIWNVYNQVQASASVGDTTTTWPYTTAAFRVANGQTTNRIDYLQGLPGPPIDVIVLGYSSNSSASIPQAVGVGIDSTTTNVATLNVGNVGAASTSLPSVAYLNGSSAYLSIGLHNINRLEFSGATGTTTWIGAIAANQIQTGIRGTFWY